MGVKTNKSMSQIIFRVNFMSDFKTADNTEMEVGNDKM